MKMCVSGAGGGGIALVGCVHVQILIQQRRRGRVEPAPHTSRRTVLMFITRTVDYYTIECYITP